VKDVREFLGVARVLIAPITDREAETALVAFSRYGKGRGHPAQLNLGDCFAYALAKTMASRCCSKGTTSARPTSPLPSPCPNSIPRAEARIWRNRAKAVIVIDASLLHTTH
jgi:hypothetical protein